MDFLLFCIELGNKISNDPGPKTRATKELVKSTVTGVVTVYDELVNNTLSVVKESSNATANILQHKYGKEIEKQAYCKNFRKNWKKIEKF